MLSKTTLAKNKNSSSDKHEKVVKRFSSRFQGKSIGPRPGSAGIQSKNPQISLNTRPSDG